MGVGKIGTDAFYLRCRTLTGSLQTEFFDIGRVAAQFEACGNGRK
jgi:hypothetical protein